MANTLVGDHIDYAGKCSMCGHLIGIVIQGEEIDELLKEENYFYCTGCYDISEEIAFELKTPKPWIKLGISRATYYRDQARSKANNMNRSNKR
jgi:hypothetical protein